MALSLKSKVGLGLLLGYTSFEVYMHLRTRYVIRKRETELEAASDDDRMMRRFSSQTVNGMFVNPFREYRPQTGFEFMMVRIMELFESFYGNAIEMHDRFPSDSGEFKEVGDLLKTHHPNLEILRENLRILNECIASKDFRALKNSGGWARFFSLFPKLADQMMFTWLGQLCSLVQVSGINILTDPMLGDHLMTKNVGPLRLIKSPMSLEDIQYATDNKLNFVLVSHDHPDHLEMDTVSKIGNSATWIVPLGLKRKLARKGIYNIIEMDWWDSVPLNQFITLGHDNVTLPDEYDVVCVPAMHWLGRYVVDSNRSLWASFIIRRNGHSILYHAGDTGYCRDLFELIGRKYGPVSLSLLPIGQYCPLWHQKPRHTSPLECLEIVKSTSSKFMMGVHWGTFKLSSEPILEPKNLLLELSQKLGRLDSIKVPEFGLTYLYDLQNDTETQLHGTYSRVTSPGPELVTK